MRQNIILCLFFLVSLFSFAQQNYSENERIVHGKVTDSTNFPLSGVNVLLKRTQKTYNTDLEGNYTIRAATADTLIFSYVGMKSQKIKADKNEINVVLVKENYNLHDGGYIPIKLKNREEITGRVTLKDIKNANNARYIFNKSAKKNVFVIYVSELTSYNFNTEDLEFQKKFKIKYSITGSDSIEFSKKYNKMTFRYLNNKFKKSWQTEIRKDAIGLDEFLK
jgi:hypothetical protein